jgi:hypothetical protein
VVLLPKMLLLLAKAQAEALPASRVPKTIPLTRVALTAMEVKKVFFIIALGIGCQ